MKHTYTCPCLNQTFDIDVRFSENSSSDDRANALLMLDAYLFEKLCSDKTQIDVKESWKQWLLSKKTPIVQISYSSDPFDGGLIGFAGVASLTLQKK